MKLDRPTTERQARRAISATGLVLGLTMALAGGACARQAAAPARDAVAGNPAMETLLQRCTVPGTSTTIRLYRGNGGATTAFWYSLTRERPGSRETEFWSSYGTPVVTGIACRAGGVELIGERASAVATLTADAIERDLVPRPLVYWRGEPRRVSRGDARGAWGDRAQLAVAVPAFALGLALAAFSGVGLVNSWRV
jgi:hypothetical protein